jgi:hypothetical protein
MNAEAMDLDTLRAIGCTVAVALLLLGWPWKRMRSRDPWLDGVPIGQPGETAEECEAREEREAIERAIENRDANTPAGLQARIEIGNRVKAAARERERIAQQRAALRRAAR